MAITFPANPANGETHTHNGQIYVYNSTRGYWLLKKSADVSVQQAQRSTFVATASQTTHSVVYDAGSPVVVSVNGVMLNPSDFTAENGTSITFETALTVNDEVDIVFYQPTASNLTRHSVSDTAPSNASSGDLWFNSANLKTYVYYDDGSSAQWVVTNPLGADGADGAAGADGSSVAAYANFAAFANGTTEGDFAFAQDTKALYVWDGTEWDRVYSGPQQSVEWETQLDADYTFVPGSNPTTLTVSATDPDGFPINYNFSTVPASTNAANITQGSDPNTNQFTITPNNFGTFTLRVTADDGVSTIKTTSSIQVMNPPQLLDLSGGTGGTSGSTVYTASGGAVVTSPYGTYNSGSNYWMEYLFDGATNTGSTTDYWLTSGGTSGDYLEVDLSSHTVSGTPIAYIEKIIIYPYSRSDSFTNITSVDISNDGTTWTNVSGDLGMTSTTHPLGASEQVDINSAATYIRLQMSRTGNWGYSMHELQIYAS